MTYMEYSDIKTEEIEKERKLINLGMELAKIKQEFWYSEVVKFLKGQDEEHHGEMYFSNLKPLYDKYGYELINTILMNWEECR